MKGNNATIDWARTPFLVHGASEGLLLGGLTSNMFETQVSNANGVFSLTNVLIQGLQGRAGKNMSTEVAWMQFGGNFSQLFLNYADKVKEYNPPVRSRVVDDFFSTGAGECDWYSHYANINQQTVIDELNALSGLTSAGYKYYIMDDGWGSNQSLHYYNWSSWDPIKFPNGISPCVQKAHEAGIKFAVWNRIDYAPIWVVQNHPDWCASIDNNDPSNSVLNISLPAVQSYMANVFASWKSEGIDGLKVDFIIASLYWTWNAAAWNLNLTRTHYVNLYLDALDRLAAHYNLTILLCGTPYGYPSLARYQNLVASRVTGDPQPQGGLQTKEIKTALMRSYWWARTFNTPDPDAYNTRDMRGLMVAAAVGGVLYHGNDYTHLITSNAKLAWQIHWNAPAIPDNVCFNDNLTIARGTLSEYSVVIAANIDEQNSCQFTITGLLNGTSAIIVSKMCSVGGINGQYGMNLGPGQAEMLILYTGDAPLNVLSCQEMQIILLMTLLVTPLAMLGLSVLVQFRKSINEIIQKAIRKSLSSKK
ncbi:MAG TPA: alpha-galactosidase [Candidatus Lokiarchaeia archaeon]|nr:alpha-galactosidase [Candidatus Lokiarchaeia archaeon]